MCYYKYVKYHLTIESECLLLIIADVIILIYINVIGI